MTDLPLHYVNQRDLEKNYPKNSAILFAGMGCFWGAERLFWEQEGVWVTSVGFGAGHSHQPSYRQVCEGNSGHCELVKIVFQPQLISLSQLLTLFFGEHDPTQGNRQGNDIGSQYRSMLLLDNQESLAQALEFANAYDIILRKSGFPAMTTQLSLASQGLGSGYWLAEDYHQQYLAKNPTGYCGLAGTGVACPVGLVKASG